MSARALIADDEAHLAEHLRARLQHFWPALEFLPLAANGVEALRALNEEEPEIAFLDIRMPGLTGIELAKRIDTHTHVVFVTAFDQYAVEAFARRRWTKCSRSARARSPAPGDGCAGSVR